ncbi:MAG: MBL fold metallo-hydrolase [Erysipelotrichaceae bacterium]|nr:MBL fold metallo-hydrolase [Erysipelotrichaceae bacterium]
MNGYWIYAGIILFTIGLADSFPARVILAVVWILTVRHSLNRKAHGKITLIILLMTALSLPLLARINSGRVIAVKNGYQIIRNGFVNILIYSDDEAVELDDLVSFDIRYRRINSYDNFDPSTFQSWARGQNICWYGSLEKYSIVKKELSLRKAVYSENRRRGNDWANQMLFGSGSELTNDLKSLFTASGMHLSLLASWIRKRLGRHYYPVRTLKLTVNLLFMLAWFLHFPFATVRVLTGYVAELLFEDKRDRYGWQITVLSLLFPYMIKSVSFLLPMGIKILNAFSPRRSQLTGRLFIIMVQLYFYGYCDLSGILLFGIQRHLSGLLFLLSIMVSLLSVSIPIPQEIYQLASAGSNLKPIILNGRISLPVLALAVKMLWDYSLNRKKKFLVIVILILLANNYQAVLQPGYTVTFLDVGQGDCALITFPYSCESLLIDTGGSYYKDVGNDIVIPLLRAKGIRKTEVILSHSDYDHAGGLESLRENNYISRVYDTKQKEIRTHGLTIINPLYDEEYIDINENSQINYADLGGFGFLFLGDISSAVEEELCFRYGDLPVTVCKLAHHGSYTATSERLLNTFRFPVAVISAGRGNRYGHPNFAILEKLLSNRIKVLCTKYQHAIEFRIYRNLLIYHTVGGYWGVLRR